MGETVGVEIRRTSRSWSENNGAECLDNCHRRRSVRKRRAAERTLTTILLGNQRTSLFRKVGEVV